MPANVNDSTTAGPEFWAATVPVRTKIPVPMIAPMPSMVRLSAPRARFKLWSVSASVWSSVTLFRRRRFMRPSMMSASSCRNDGEMAARVGPRGGPVKPLEAVIGRFPRDHDVVRVGFAQARRRDLDEFGLGAERFDIAHPAIAHAAAEPTHHLEDHVGRR